MSDEPGRLRRAVDRVRNEPGLGRNVLSLAVLVVLAILVGGYILGHQRYNPPWQDYQYVWATFSEAPAVAPGVGQGVRIAGVEVGDIRANRVTENGHAQLLLAIKEEKYSKPIYTNATVVLRPQSPLNDMYIELDPGGPPGEPLPPYGVLPMSNSESPIQVDQVLSHLDEQARFAVQSMLNAADVALARAPQDLPPGLQAVDQVLADLQPVVEELDERRAKIESLVTSVSQMSIALGRQDEQLAQMITSLRTTLSTLSDRSAALRKTLAQLPELVGNLNTATSSVQDLSAQLDPTLDSIRKASETLPDSLAQLTETVNKLRVTVQKAKPVANKLPTVAGDLRPFVADLNATMVDAKPITEALDPMTAGLVPYIPDLQAFVHQTNSVMSLRDENGGIALRALLPFGPSSLPIKGLDQVAPNRYE